MQQVIVTGLGGQGVLFVSRLLAETALDSGYSALLSETHGMAQRGGNVISHLKIWRPESYGTTGTERNECGDPGYSCEPPPGGRHGAGLKAGTPAAARGFTSPLVRPGMADVLFSLHPDALLVHGCYLKPGGRAFCNTPNPGDRYSLDATRIALGFGSAVSANLVLLGFAAASGDIFCTSEEIEAVLARLAGKRLETSLRAYRAGLNEWTAAAGRAGAASRA